MFCGECIVLCSQLTTVVECIGFGNIQRTKLTCFTNWNGWILGLYGIQAIVGESIASVVHYASIVIANFKSVGVIMLNLLKLVLKAICNIVIDNINIVVPVWPSVLMVEANDVAQLVEDNAESVTPKSKIYSLRLVEFRQTTNK